MQTQYQEILHNMDQIDPITYGKTRNFLWGAVSHLSPYVSRGVISTKQIVDSLFQRGFKPYQIERLLQQLTWRDYFQRTAQHVPDISEKNVKNNPVHFKSNGIPTSILQADTGIDAIDEGIEQLLETGWIHNHMRMYISMLHANVARCDWRAGARWMYYHLLDADVASNDLSWQWVCGANSNKQYVANQENINKYSGSKQRSTFLDIPYEAFENIAIPQSLKTTEPLTLIPTEVSIQNLKSTWPIRFSGEVQPNALNQVLVYTWNNLDPLWRRSTSARKILLLDRLEFEKRPVSEKTVSFVLELSKNIEGMEIYFGTFSELQAQLPQHAFYFKEHPSQINWQGHQDSRDWIFPEVTNYTPSFFGYWKKCEKYVKSF
jgi:deoxyribodipyrimidine photo-lyase